MAAYYKRLLLKVVAAIAIGIALVTIDRDYRRTCAAIGDAFIEASR